ncbi:MAG: hypothetical protein E4H20_07310 [Spirochaetales bacterium]|nr:MAG: hypothetical protein E4H20_07310 [Spirochaetales bacterium]
MLFTETYTDVRHDFITVWDACTVDYKKWQWSPFQILAENGYQYIRGLLNENQLLLFSSSLFPDMENEDGPRPRPTSADEWQVLFFQYFRALREVGRKQPDPCTAEWENLESFSRMFMAVKSRTSPA